MRTNIVLDDTLITQAMKAGPYKTRKEAVDAGLRLLARQVAYRDLLALRGKLRWDDSVPAAGHRVMEDATRYTAGAATETTTETKPEAAA